MHFHPVDGTLLFAAVLFSCNARAPPNSCERTAAWEGGYSEDTVTAIVYSVMLFFLILLQVAPVADPLDSLARSIFGVQFCRVFRIRFSRT